MNWIERLNRHAAGRISVGEALSVEVLHWAYNPHLPDNILHRHTYFEVCFVGAWGSGQFKVGQGTEQTEHFIGPGHLFIARPGVLHQIVNAAAATSPASPYMELLWILFHAPTAANRPTKRNDGADNPHALFDAFRRATDVLVEPERAAGVGAIWNALRVAASGSGDTAGQTTALTTALLLAIAQAGSRGDDSSVQVAGGEPLSVDGQKTGRHSDQLARQAVEYIHQHLSRPLLAREIAAALAVSPRHLTRIVRAYAGVGPQEYVELTRLDRARTLLLRTDDPIKQVAALSGYKDVAHFTRAFARRFGCPPGAFRKTGGTADKTLRGGDIKTPGALV